MNARKTITMLFLLVLLLGPLASCTATDNPDGKAAPDFTLATHDGKQFTLSKFKGNRGVVLVFFATWCPSCMAEVPEVKKLATSAKDKNVLVYGVNIEQSKRIVEKFVKDQQINYRILLDSNGEAAKAYGITGIPTVIGIDADGIVRYRAHLMPKDDDAFFKTLTKSLKDK